MKKAKFYINFWPTFMIGIIEGLIVTLALFCFLLAKGLDIINMYKICGFSALFIAALLAAGAYYTRKEEMSNNNGERKILKIYQSLDIDEQLKNEMINDTLQENIAWKKKWQENDNAASSLMPAQYAHAVFSGFLAGALIILANNYFMQFPDYSALFIPLLLLAILGFYKYKHINQKPTNGMLLISLSGMAAAAAAYYAGSFF